MSILLPSEQDPQKHEQLKKIAGWRKLLIELLGNEAKYVVKAREEHGENSVQFERAQNRYEHTSRDYGERIKEYNDKLDGKQLNLF